MTSPPKRRPLPALVFLAALTLLTALVWWRVLNRDESHAAGGSNCPTATTTTNTVLPRPADIHVTVLNSTDRAGLARSVAKALGTDGFQVDKYTNDPKHGSVRKIAEIRYLSSARTAAQLLSYYVPGAKLVPVTTRSTKTPALAVSLGPKFKALATARQVQVKMRSVDGSLAPTTQPAEPGGSASSSC